MRTRSLRLVLLSASLPLILGGCSARSSPSAAVPQTTTTPADTFGATPAGAASFSARSAGDGCDPVPSPTTAHEAAGEVVAARENLGRCINTVHTEALPRFTADGDRLYFLRAGSQENVGGTGGGEDIWYAERTESGGWTAAHNMGAPLNTTMNNSVVAASANGEWLLVSNEYRADGQVEGGFSKVRRDGSGWGEPEPLEIEDWYSRTRWVSASLSADESALLFHAERDDGLGGTDLYVSLRDDSGRWGEPVNLGEDINTPGDEITPFLAADGETLYFSSDGRGGYGGQDIFVARRLDGSWQRWSEPQNLGERFNSPGFDAYFVIPAGDEYGYLASSSGATGGTDLFRVPLHDPAPAVVSADPEPDPEPAPDSVIVVREGTRIVLDYVHFDVASARLRPESQPELQRILNFLKSNPVVHVEIQGHTDSTGSAAINHRLSTSRAQSVRSYLIDHGVEPARIEARGYGSLRPVATNETDEGRRLNRRVELRILSGEGVLDTSAPPDVSRLGHPLGQSRPYYVLRPW